jgi:hypothetical protein
MSIRLKWFSFTGSILLSACAPLHSYVEPSGPETAELRITNNAPEALGLQIYEDAADCSKKRRVIWMDAGKEVSIRIKAADATAYSLNTEHMAGLAIAGYHAIAIGEEACLSMFSFRPKVGGTYAIAYQALPGGCKVHATEVVGGNSHPFDLTRRTFVRPLSEDGAFCARQEGA